MALSKLTADLLTFAKEGLRTLVVAQKPLSEIEYYRFDEALHRIKTSTAEDKDEQLNALFDSIEQGL
jgi:magnesium-transporting ATPase (P-type)